MTATDPSATRQSKHGLNRSRRRLLGTIGHRTLVLLLLAYLLAPFCWMLLYSLYPPQALQQTTPDLSPAQLTVDSYHRLLSDSAF